MSIGNLESDNMGIDTLNEFSAINFIIYLAFIFFLPILFVNIFTGITIDEIQNLFETSRAEDALAKIDYIIKFEDLKKSLILKYVLPKIEFLIDKFYIVLDKIGLDLRF